MALTRAFRDVGTGGTPSLLVNSDTVDRHVQVRTSGPGALRIGFTSAEVASAGLGFPVPPEGVEFTLQAGDEIWLNGQFEVDGSVYFLITKEA